MFYALDQSIKLQRQKHFTQLMAETEEAQARTNAIYYAKVKAEAELAHKRLIAEEEERQRKLEVGMAKIEREFQEQKAQRGTQSEWEHEARLRRDLATLREITTPISQPSRSNPMAAQGVNPRFWATPKPSSGTTVITGSGGVYTTHGGAAGGSTIIETVPGHYEIRQRDGAMSRVIVTP